ncbi:MAG: hypothetical protein ACQEP7_02435 [bacterium]
MDLQQMWEDINRRVDWFVAGSIAFAVAALLVGGYAAWFHLTKEGPLEKHKLGAVRQVEVDESVLEDLPDLEDIEVEPAEKTEELPERFAELKGTDLFLPLTARRISEDMLPGIGTGPEGTDGSDTGVKPEEKTLPSIEGFEITGRILGDDEQVKIALLKRSEDDRMFIAREDEYLEGTEIQVKDISDTSVLLTKPEHKETEFQFQLDRMNQQIKEQILQH